MPTGDYKNGSTNASVQPKSYPKTCNYCGQRLLCLVPESARFAAYYMMLTVV